MFLVCELRKRGIPPLDEPLTVYGYRDFIMVNIIRSRDRNSLLLYAERYQVGLEADYPIYLIKAYILHIGS